MTPSTLPARIVYCFYGDYVWQEQNIYTRKNIKRVGASSYVKIFLFPITHPICRQRAEYIFPMVTTYDKNKWFT